MLPHLTEGNGINRSVRLIPPQLRRGRDHVAKIEEGDMAQPLIAFAIDVFRIGQKTPVAIDIGGAEGPDLRLKLGVVVRIVELRPVLPVKAIKGMDRHQLHRSEEHTSELQSLMRNPYAVLCL